MTQQKTAVTILREIAKQAGATVIEKVSGHYHIQGKLLVNYWPNSKKRTAHVDGTVGSKTNVTPKEAVIMAFTKPARVKKGEKRDIRDEDYASDRRSLLTKSNQCHWCGQFLILRTSTLDHRVPLSRGGLDNACNWVLACLHCNSLRADDMPELDGYVFRNMADDPDWLRTQISQLQDSMGTLTDQIANTERVINGAFWRGDTPAQASYVLQDNLKGRLRAVQGKLEHYTYLLHKLDTNPFASRFVEAARRMLESGQFRKLELAAQGLINEN